MLEHHPLDPDRGEGMELLHHLRHGAADPVVAVFAQKGGAAVAEAQGGQVVQPAAEFMDVGTTASTETGSRLNR